MEKVAVLMTVYNRKEKTIRCLKHLSNNVIPATYKLDIYVTDDACTDGTPEAIKELLPDAHIVKGTGSLFWNRGMYAAWAKASETYEYDFYLWLNDDTFLLPNALERLLTSAKRHSEAIIVGATVDSHTLKTVTYGGWKKVILVDSDCEVEVDYFNGNIVLIPAKVFRTVGNLDRYYSHSKGDFDYGLRAKEFGYKIFQIGRLGICDTHETLDAWCNPEIPMSRRLKILYKPNGMPPKETFYFEKRHYGLIVATYHWFTVHFRCLFPKIWLLRN